MGIFGKFWVMSFGEFCREHGHGALLGAYECGCLNCFEMRFFNGVSFEDVGYEGCRERVACAYSVGHLHFGCGLERNVAGGEDVTAVDAAGEYEHLEVVFAKKDPAFVLKVDSGVSEHAAH